MSGDAKTFDTTTKDGSSGEYPLTADEAKDLCLMGQGALCCIFLAAGPRGFVCLKFSVHSAHLIDRAKAKQMHARREGSCAENH